MTDSMPCPSKTEKKDWNEETKRKCDPLSNEWFLAVDLKSTHQKDIADSSPKTPFDRYKAINVETLK